MIEDLKPFIAYIHVLNYQAYLSYAPEVELIIRNKVKDESIIQQKLDGLLDFCGDAQNLLLYKKLCRYYWEINTAKYISYYRGQWDKDEASA